MEPQLFFARATAACPHRPVEYLLIALPIRMRVSDFYAAGPSAACCGGRADANIAAAFQVVGCHASWARSARFLVFGFSLGVPFAAGSATATIWCIA